MRNSFCSVGVFALLFSAMSSWSVSAGTCTYGFSWFQNGTVNDFHVPVTLEEGVSGFSYAGFASGGADLRVSDGTNNLAYEIENWNPAGKSVVWVKVPVFSNATVLTFAWGTDAAGIEAADVAGFWDEAFAVVHFGGETVVNSVNGEALTGDSELENSVLGNGESMTRRGVLRQEGAPIQSYAATTNTFTISFWIKSDARVGGDGNDASRDAAYLFQWGPTSGQRALLFNWGNGKDGVLRFFNLNNISGDLPVDDNVKVLDDFWHHFAFTCDGSQLVVYRDGYVISTKSVGSFKYTMPENDTSFFSIGGTRGGLHLYQGSLDEVRFENVCRGADYIRASVETQSRAVPGNNMEIPFADYTGAALADFPVFVQLDQNCGIVPESFYTSLLNGTSHIRDKRTGQLLPIEVEHAFFNSFDDTIGFWTLMPQYSSTDAIVLSTAFDCYKPGAADAVEINPLGPAGVWNTNDYLLVFHMNPTGLLHDVVHNVRLPTNCRGTQDRLAGYPVAVDGPTGPYGAYRSTTNAVQRKTDVSIDHALTNVYTISWWMKQDADEFTDSKPETYCWTIFGASALKGAGYSGNGTAANRIALWSGGKEAQLDVPDDGWHHYAYAVDGTHTYCYRDGELMKTTTQVKNFGFTGGISKQSVMLMSSSNPVKDAFRGCGDEFRVEAVCRSADWIRASYRNQLAWRNGTPWQLTPHFAADVAAEVAVSEDGRGELTASAVLSCRTTATVTMYWGAADQGKHPQGWEHAMPQGSLADGTVAAQVALPAGGGRFVCRFRAENAFGTAWSEPRWVEQLPTGRPRVSEFAIAYDGTEPLRNFPLCVRIPATVELPADPGVVRFTDGHGTVLAWEVEVWNPAGESVVWVRMPQLTADSVLQLEFRSSWTASDEWTAGEVWDKSAFMGVYHFMPGSGMVTRDSSVIAHNIRENGLRAYATNGVAGSAFFWPGDGTGATKGDAGGSEICDFRNGFTFSGWINIPADSTAAEQVFAKHELRGQTDIASDYFFQCNMCYTGGASRGDVYFWLYAKNSMFTPYGMKFNVFGISDGGCNPNSSNASEPIAVICRASCPDDGWHHYAFTHDGLYLRAYRDGELVNSAFWPFILNAGILDHKFMTNGFGNNVNQFNRARGALDEYRFERTGRSAAWLKACYDNQRPGSTFVTFRRTILPGFTLIFR